MSPARIVNAEEHTVVVFSVVIPPNLASLRKRLPTGSRVKDGGIRRCQRSSWTRARQRRSAFARSPSKSAGGACLVGLRFFPQACVVDGVSPKRLLGTNGTITGVTVANLSPCESALR